MVSGHIVSSGTLVRPIGIAPAAISRAAAGAVSVARKSLRATSPAQWGIPSTANDSLIVHGTPRNGGSSSSGEASATRRSASSAAARASS